EPSLRANGSRYVKKDWITSSLPPSLVELRRTSRASQCRIQTLSSFLRTQEPIRRALSFRTRIPRTSFSTSAGGYGSLLSQGRRWRSNIPGISAVIASQRGAHSRDPLARNDVAMVLDTPSPPRRDAPEALLLSSAQRGRGECRMPAAPAVSCALGSGRTHTSNNEYTGITRHSRTQWF